VILTNKMGFSNSNKLANAIEELTGERLLVSTKIERTRNNKVHIRYGGVEPSLSNEAELNSIQFIKLCSNKKVFSDLLVQNNIPTVIFLPKNTYTEGVVLVRSILSSYGGKGITICKNIEEVNSAEGHWMSPFIKFNNEYRVHVFNGKITRVQKKIRREEEQEEYPIRNFSRGYFFSVRTTLENTGDRFPKLIDFVDSVVSLLPEKHFCGLDLGYSRELGSYVVIENNSAPGFEESTMYLYASEFAKDLGFSLKTEDISNKILPNSL